LRIKEIFIHNLNSLAGEHRIRFDEPPLAGSSLFVITGPTGAGKSSILDAICLALYDKSPRLRSLSKDVIQHSGALVSKGASFCEVRVTYAEGPDSYRSMWRVEYNRNHNLNDRKQALDRWDPSRSEWSLIASGRSVPEKNTAITSLDFDQFTRSILLAQGDFSALLRAKKEERYALMEKLSGEDIYRRMGKRVFEVCKQKREETDQERRALEAIKLLDESQIQDYKDHIHQHNAKLVNIRATYQVLNEQLWRKQQVEILSERLALKDSQLSEWEAENRAFQPQRERLQLFEKHQRLVIDLEKLRSEEEKRDEKQANLENNNLALEQIRQELKKLREDWAEKLGIDSSEENFSERFEARMETIHEARENEAKAAEKHQQKLENVREAKLSMEKAQNALDREMETESKLQASQAQLHSKYRSLEARKPAFDALPVLNQGYIDFTVQKEKVYRQMGLDLSQNFLGVMTSLQEAIRQKAKQRIPDDRLEDAKRVQDDLLAIYRKEQDLENGSSIYLNLAEKELSVQTKTEEIAAMESRIPQSEILLGKLEAERTSQMSAIREREEQQARAAREHDLASLRKELIAGEPCPLCGSMHHPGLPPRPLHTAEDGLLPLRDQLSELETRLEKGRSMLISLEATRQEKQAQLELDNQKIEDLKREWLPFLSKFPMTPPFPDAFGVHKEAITRERLHLTQRLAAIQTSQQCQAEVEGLQQKHKQLAQLDENLQNLLSRFQVHQSVDDVGKIPSVLSDLDNQKKAFERLADDLRSLEMNLGVCQANKANSQIQWEKANQSLTEHLAASEDIETKFNLARQLREALPQIENPLAISRQELYAMKVKESRLSTLVQDRKGLIPPLEHLRDVVANMEKNLLIKLEEAGIGSREGLAVLVIQESERTLLIQKGEKLDEEGTSLRSVRDSTGKELSELLAKDISDTPIDQLKKQAKDLTDQEAEMQKEIGGISQILRDDEARRKEYQEVRQQLGVKEAALKPFELLDDLIGDKEGKRFNEFAQEITLRQLIRATNHHIAQIHGRYLLDMPQEGEREDELYVVDQYMGNTRRSANSTLSGGETFLVSLSMALGLSDMSAGKADLGNLFIDEGFGSLDATTLEAAIGMLEDLMFQKKKHIGIVSHVTELKDRISTQIQVIPTAGGMSRIACV